MKINLSSIILYFIKKKKKKIDNFQNIENYQNKINILLLRYLPRHLITETKMKIVK